MQQQHEQFDVNLENDKEDERIVIKSLAVPATQDTNVVKAVKAQKLQSKEGRPLAMINPPQQFGLL